jgi:hypothetical protein
VAPYGLEVTELAREPAFRFCEAEDEKKPIPYGLEVKLACERTGFSRNNEKKPIKSETNFILYL